MNSRFNDKEKTIAELLGSFLKFTQVFYKERTGRKFELSYPPGRESHYLSICKELVKVARGETNRLIINVPPRYGKTELLIHFVAWTLARFPDSNYLYTSYSHSLAKKQTQTIRNIIQLPLYKDLFDIRIKDDVSAKDNFETSVGGSVYAAGAGGSITGRGAGIKSCNRFGGCIVIDDIHKPDEVTSDTMRESINAWYHNTLQSRTNGPSVPIIFIGQRLHEDDLAANLIKSGDWHTLIIPAIDLAGNPLHPEMHDLASLKEMQRKMPYEFASQYQQDPQPAGGGIFKKDWFVTHEYEPDVIATFITVDTAETTKDWNDASVFSFWGIYKIKHRDVVTDMFALHWLDCRELRIEPKDLEDEFYDFYANCMRHKVKPLILGIEKKSTGVTLSSLLKKYQGLRVIDIERTKASGSKTSRYLEIQPFVTSGQISLPLYGRHTDKVITHMSGITANNSHAHDDIADTAYDAVKLALIDGVIINKSVQSTDYNVLAKSIMSTTNKIDRLKRNAFR